VELILCGEIELSSWDYYVLKECVKVDVHGLSGGISKSLIDMHSIYLCTAATDYIKNATGTVWD
jgi:alpha-N-arabinofuranosidase